MPAECLPHRKPRLSLCPESMCGLGMIIPIYLLTEQIYSDCLVCARPCSKSCEDRHMVFVFKDHTHSSVMDRNGGKTQLRAIQLIRSPDCVLGKSQREQDHFRLGSSRKVSRSSKTPT